MSDLKRAKHCVTVLDVAKATGVSIATVSRGTTCLSTFDALQQPPDRQGIFRYPSIAPVMKTVLVELFLISQTQKCLSGSVFLFADRRIRGFVRAGEQTNFDQYVYGFSLWQSALKATDGSSKGHEIQVRSAVVQYKNRNNHIFIWS